MKQLAAALLMLLLLCAPALAEGGVWSPDVFLPLPVISIDTESGSSAFITEPVRDTKLAGGIAYVDAVITVSGGDGAGMLMDVPAQVKARGNWTLNYPKKSIRIKFDKKQPMLGLNEGQAYKSWVLLADWKDLSMTHNSLACYLASAILGADGYYAAQCRTVEVYINGEYWGVYLLTEQQEVNPGRVEITEAEKDDPNRYTGYLFEYDAYFMEESHLPGADPFFEVYHEGLTGEQQGYTIKSDITSSRQTSFLRSYVRLAYRLCRRAVTEGRHYAFNEKYTELVPIEGVSVQETVAQVIDLRSLVDTFILNEIACNPDLGWSSFYISLDMGEGGSRRLTFQAPWDFDSAFGIRADYESAQGPYATHSGNPWLSLFAGEEWFLRLVKERWAELKSQGVPEQALALIAAHRDIYAGAYARNYARWPERIAEGNHELIETLNACRSQAEAADYLTRWLTERLAYLDSQWQ